MNKRVLMLVAACACVFGILSASVSTFAGENADARELVEAGLIKGKADGSLALEDEFSRAEGAVILVRLAGLEREVQGSDLGTFFDDVPLDSWACEYISVAFSRGYIKGVGDYRFEPERSMTGMEFATVLGRMLSYGVEEAEGIKRLAQNRGMSEEEIDYILGREPFLRSDMVRVLSVVRNEVPRAMEKQEEAMVTEVEKTVLTEELITVILPLAIGREQGYQYENSDENIVEFVGRESGGTTETLQFRAIAPGEATLVFRAEGQEHRHLYRVSENREDITIGIGEYFPIFLGTEGDAQWEGECDNEGVLELSRSGDNGEWQICGISSGEAVVTLKMLVGGEVAKTRKYAVKVI